jgi:hypothetical protein
MAIALTLGIAASLWFASPNVFDSTGTENIAWGYGGGGGGFIYVPPPPPGTTVLTGLVDETGVFLEEVVAASADGLTQVSVPEGATGQTADGEPLTEIAIVEMETPPAAPADGNIIGLVYEFGPEGATFDQPITLTFTYDPAQLPEGVAEEDLVLAVWDDAAGRWIELPSVVDVAAKTVSAQLDHFSSFTIAYIPAPAAFTVGGLVVMPLTIEEGGMVSITVTVGNTGDLEGTYSVELTVNEQVVETAEVTLSGGESQDVPFTVTSAIAGRHTVRVAGQSGSFTVKPKEEPVEPEPEPPTPEPPTPEPPAPVARAEIVTSNLSIAPVQIQVGEMVVVSVLVMNLGDAEGTYDVTLMLGGEEVGIRTVTLATGATRTVTFQVVPDKAGTFDVEIDSLSKRLTVKEIPPPPEPGVNPLLIGGIIAVCAVVTAVVVVLMIRRRRESF